MEVSEIKMLKVESSNIDSLGHHAPTETLRVKFKTNKIYDYAHVPATKYQEIVDATSVGSTFNKLVKSQPGVHPFTQVN